MLPGTALADAAGTYAQWKALQEPTAQISFYDGYRFLKDHGNWPQTNNLLLKVEEAALNQSPDPSIMQQFCSQYSPISGRGMFACVAARAGDDEQRATWIRHGWRQGDFSPYEEALILSNWGKKLTRTDHRKRAERLLYEGKTTAAKRMLPLVPAQARLYEVRIALINGDRNANRKLNALSAAEQNSSGIVFDRIRWRHEKGMDDGVADMFMRSPKKPPYPDLWWPLRVVAVRDAISSGQYSNALEIIARHGKLKTTESLAEALWLKGWITLEYQRDAQTAYQDFYRLYTEVSTPVSKARAAYWAATAAKKNGNSGIAREWLEKAARHPTVFYGQLAHLELDPSEPLELPSQPYVSDSARESLNREEQVQVVRMLANTGEDEMANMFLTHLASEAKDPERLALLAEFGEQVRGKHGGVIVAKQALRQGIVLTRSGWPTPSMPENLEIEPALALAITRQESEFDPRAQSRANARGLMQLLPGTATQVAKRNAIPYSPARIWDEETNVQLGSAYLGHLVDAWDNSYVLAIASYNAGPANARRWREDFGHPSGDVEQAVNWIESIPFGETRNYVQRVLENLQVYRALLHREQKVALAQDLTR